MRYVAFITCLAATMILSANPVFALSMTKMSLAKMASSSSSVVIAEAEDVDTEAGNNAIGEQTMVTMKITETIWGHSQPSNLVFFLPEGSSTWIEEVPMFAEIPGAPKIVPSEKYLLFLRAQGWFDSPFTGFQQGVYRIKMIEEKEYPVSDTGQCITSIGDSIVWGGAIAPFPKYWGPYFNGVRYYFGNQSVLDPPGAITDDEGEGSYPDDVFFALDPDSVHKKLSGCMEAAEVINLLEDKLANFSPSGHFQEKTTLEDSRFRTEVMAADDLAEESVCLVEESIPYTCEVL